MWPQEITGADRDKFTLCCGKSKVKLDPIPESPAKLRTLLANNRYFRHNIRAYNTALQMASSTANVVSLPSGAQQFRINGTIQHRMGSLLPSPGQQPQYAQLYILDPLQQQRQRMEIMQNTLHENTLPQLQTMLLRDKRYVQLYRATIEVERVLQQNVIDCSDRWTGLEEV